MKSMNVKDKRIWIDGKENKITEQKYLGQTIWQKEPGVYLAQDSDFVSIYGFWIYKGEALEVEIPTHINGELVTSTSFMFSGSGVWQATPVIKVVLNHSNISDMKGMFEGSKATILDLSSFNTSNVTSMAQMFQRSSATTLDLSSFDTSNVTDMQAMFYASSATTGYARTQADANRFNASSNKPTGLNFVVKPYLAQDSDFVKVSIYWIYRGSALEVEIPTHINGELVTSTQNMFSGNSPYQATPVTKVVLNHSNVTDMRYMFEFSSATTLDLSSFNISNVTDMSYMFRSSKATTLDLSSFNTSNVTNMSYMLAYSQATTLDLSSFDTSNVTSVRSMFAGSIATTLDLSSFNTSKVTDMSSMFASSVATTLDLSSFNTSNVHDMGFMFYNSSATIGYARRQEDADKLNASSGKPTRLNFVVKPSSDVYLAQDRDFVNVDGYWVYRGTALEVEIPTHINGQVVTSTANMFSGDYFFQATPVTKVVLNHSNVNDMSYMFNYSSATTLDLSSFDTSNVYDMSFMFYGSGTPILDLSSFNTTNVDTMYGMFQFSSAIVLDLSNFNTSYVYDMSYMFDGSSATIGYARTQEDADRFNASEGKPAGLNFVVKP